MNFNTIYIFNIHHNYTTRCVLLSVGKHIVICEGYIDFKELGKEFFHILPSIYTKAISYEIYTSFQLINFDNSGKQAPRLSNIFHAQLNSVGILTFISMQNATSEFECRQSRYFTAV